MSRNVLLLLSILLPSSLLVQACQVTLNGEDVTNDLFVTVEGESYVDCMEQSKCREAVIVDCPVVKCVNTEACSAAQIINFTHSVQCEGLHACHNTEIIAAESVPNAQTVLCEGAGACDVARIVGDIDQVTCRGAKSCRKAHVQGSKLVKCQHGSAGSRACEGFATLETGCLYCGKEGCERYINMCRYKLLGSDDEQYAECSPENVVGNQCPDGIKHELNLELAEQSAEDLEGSKLR